MIKKKWSIFVIALLITMMGVTAFGGTSGDPAAGEITVTTKAEGSKVEVTLTNETERPFDDIVITPNVPEGLTVNEKSAAVESLGSGESEAVTFEYAAAAGPVDPAAPGGDAGTVKVTGKGIKTGDASRNMMIFLGIMIVSGAVAFFVRKGRKRSKTFLSMLVIGLLSGALFVSGALIPGPLTAAAASVEASQEVTDTFTVDEKTYDFTATITYTKFADSKPIASEPGAANQYIIEPSLLDYPSTSDTYIKTVGDWKKEGGQTGTYFENGEALSDHDIIISNGKVGVVLAVGTRNPWGYPAGSVLDAGVVKDGIPQRDTVWSLEFLMNGWDSWAPENCGTVTFELAHYDFKASKESADGIPAVKVSRKYTVLKDAGGNPCDITVITYYGVEKNAEQVYMFDTVVNNGPAAVTGKTTRFSITNKGDDGGALKYIKDARSVMSYGNKEGQEYSICYTVPEKQLDPKVNVNKNGGSLGYMELRGPCFYDAGSTTVYQEYIAISGKADTSLLSETVNKINGVETMAVTGVVTEKNSTQPVPGAVIVAKNAGGAISGFFKADEAGKFAVNLPTGTYKLFVERSGYAPGSPVDVSSAGEVNLKAGAKKEQLTVHLKDQDGNPIWGKIDIKNQYPEVRYTGNSVYQSREKGVIHAEVNDITNFEATVYGEGYFFYSNTATITAGDVSGGNVDVTIEKKFKLADGWMSGDLHHHGNKNDAFSDPTDVIPSMAISGLDVAMITDHDFTVNNKKAYDLITGQYAGGIKGFIPSEEISCSWAHFNVIPQDSNSYEHFLDSSMENHVMNQFAVFPAFLKQTHDSGATLTANHPWYSYGLFYTAKYGANGVPGGYEDGFDNIEINACSTDSENADVMISATQAWTAYQDQGTFFGKEAKKAHYLVGGSDTHDVLVPGVTNTGEFARGEAKHYASGKARTVAAAGPDKGSVKENGLAFAKAAAEGNSYVTFGPLLNLDRVPGKEYTAAGGEFTMSFTVDSLSPVKQVIILKKNGGDSYTEGTLNGTYNDQKSLAYDKAALTESGGKYTADISVAAGEKTWIAILVVDANGNYAVTNPYWILGE